MGRLTYEDIRDGIASKDCELLTGNDEFLRDNMKAKSKFSIRLSCGHVEEISYTDMMYRKNTTICKECISDRLKNTVTVDGVPFSAITGKKGVDYIIDIIKTKFECKLTNEGCKADILVRAFDKQVWMPLQVKTSGGENLCQYSFSLKCKDYTDMLVICLNFNSKKTWIIPFDDIKGKIVLTIGKTISKYEAYECKTDNLIQRIMDFYVSGKYVIDFEDAMMPIQNTKQVEHQFRQMRITKLSFLNFENPPFESIPYDYVVNGLRVQEKSVLTIDKGRFSFPLKRRVGRSKTAINYNYTDADLYWFNFPDRRHFSILNRDIMLEKNLILADGELVSDKHRRTLCLHVKTCLTSHWIAEYTFDYENVDIEKIKKIFNL
jgi:hypothetical protein